MEAMSSIDYISLADDLAYTYPQCLLCKISDTAEFAVRLHDLTRPGMLEDVARFV